MPEVWTIWNDLGVVIENLSEEEARSFLRDSGNIIAKGLYAENTVGDFIESHDGPIIVARSKENR
jgi:hypothetical protein